MASEISFSGAISASKNGAGITGSASGVINMAGDAMIENVQAVGTAAELIALQDVASPAQIFLKNLDPTNFVEIALDNGMVNTFAKLLPGEFAMFRPKVAALYAKADTAAVNLLVVAPQA